MNVPVLVGLAIMACLLVAVGLMAADAFGGRGGSNER